LIDDMIDDKDWIFLDSDGLCVEQNPCLSLPCHSNATCYNLNDGQYRCMCPPTYTGIQCDEDIDECTIFPSICRNGGT
jgi:Notch-like protein